MNNPTYSYSTPLSIHATLAMRHPHLSIPTLLSPLSTNTLDEFQSNAWCPPLSGLGITYLRDDLDGQPLPHEGSAMQVQVDDDSLHAETRGADIPPDYFPAPTVPYRGLEPEEIRRIQCTPNFVHQELGLDNDVDPAASDVIGLIPDVNMYDTLRELDLQYPGVNPLDTIRNTPLHDVGMSYGQSASPAPKDYHNDDFLPAAGGQSPSPRVIRDIMSILVQPAPEFSFPPWSPAGSSFAQRFLPLQLADPTSSVSIKFEPTKVSDGERRALPAPCNLEYPNATHLSPVLNAHLGIELDELISRAERFRTRYPEREIDRPWLSHFAGKLSDRGELLNDFRCYVVGCDQRNKRRDHILVHVGAHIGQRPFACPLCPLRFLRKNECKRHEASHSGFRPYSCDICGQSFVRQDLVKRHVKRTHGQKDENKSSVVTRKQSTSRKRARLR